MFENWIKHGPEWVMNLLNQKENFNEKMVKRFLKIIYQLGDIQAPLHSGSPLLYLMNYWVWQIHDKLDGKSKAVIKQIVSLILKFVSILGHANICYSLSRKTVNTRENFWNVYCFATNQMRDETAKDNGQTAAGMTPSSTRNLQFSLCISLKKLFFYHKPTLVTWFRLFKT